MTNRPRARARRHTPGEMNKTERAYAAHLELCKIAGEIAGYWFEPVKLRLAKNTTYSPDFMVILADGLIEMHEVKGFWEDDARVKIKVAAETFWMFAFVAVTKRAEKHGGGWEFEWFGQPEPAAPTTRKMNYPGTIVSRTSTDAT